MAETKQCGTCQEIKSWSAFRIRPSTQRPKGPCNLCRRERRLIRNSSVRGKAAQLIQSMRIKGVIVSLEEALTLKSTKVCDNPGCFNSLVDYGQNHTDHCHHCLIIRGSLCAGCNTGMARFGDDPLRLRGAAEYLEANDPCYRKD